jgi:hypothetical protein
MKADIETLVGLAVRTARFDKDGGCTDVLLKQIEGYVIQKCDDPYAYGTIGMRMFEEIQDLPIPAVLAQLATLCGIRRLPLTNARENYLLELIADIKKAVSVLPNNSMRNRCRSLFSYHQSIFYGDYGYFDKAAEMQGQSAGEAIQNGDSVGVAIGWFMEMVYRFKQALFVGDTRGALDTLFELLMERYSALIEALRNSPLEVQWAQSNGPMFMLEACIWTGREHYSKWDEWATTLFSAIEKLGGPAQFVNALSMTRVGSEDDVLLEEYVKTKDAPERIATAYLVLINHAVNANDLERAGNFLREVPQDPSAKHVLAIAKRLFQND